MALPDLATSENLAARGVELDEPMGATMLAAASSTVRGAAGSPILKTTSTITLTGWGELLLVLPGQPVTAVDDAAVDGVEVHDYKLANGRLWRAGGWGNGFEPADVTVTMQHGLEEVPGDVVQLVCDLAIAGANEAEEGASDPRTLMERIDDYQVQWAQGAERVASVMELPPRTRRWLAAKFGGGAGMVAHR